MTVVVLILALCILFEAFFSGSEIALVSADKVKLRHLAERGGRRGRIIRAFLEDPGVLISTSLVGTNICVVLSTVVATLTLLQWYPQQAELLSLAVMTPLVLVFGEIVPKSLFQNYADKVVSKAIYILWGFRVLFWPLVAVGGALSDFLVRVLGLEQQTVAMSREELRLLLRFSAPEGANRISPDEQRMVRRIFTFKDLTVEQVMLPLSEVTALPLSATLEEVAGEITDKRHTRIPIYRERLDQIEGIAHAFDVLRAEPGETLAELCRPAIFVPESQPAVNTLVRLQREGQGMAVVVDEYGGATGVVTIEDILEEVVGDIDDEYDREERDLVRPEPGGTYLVEGRAPVDRVNQALKLNLPLDEDYESVAGLLLDRLKRLPRQGEELTLAGVRIEVARATERSIEAVRLHPVRKKGDPRGRPR